jgi:hypothetical protein
MIDKRIITLLAACFVVAAPALAQEKPKSPPSASVVIQQLQVAFISSGRNAWRLVPAMLARY